MNDAALMRKVQAGQDFDRDVELPLQCERIAQRDHVGKVTALDQLHGDEELAFGFAEIVHGDDVGVLDGAGRARFAEEALLHVFGFPETRAEQLERHVAPQHRVVGLPHDSHRSFAEELVQFVFAEPAVAVLGVGHRCRVSQS